MAFPIARTRKATDDRPATTSAPSLTPRLVLLIGGLVVGVTIVYATAAYVEMRRTAYAIAANRLTALSAEMVRGLVASRRQFSAVTRTVAEQPAVNAYLAQPSPALRPAAESALRTAFAPTDQTLAVQLLDRHRRPLLSVAAVGEWTGPALDASVVPDAATSDSAAIGLLTGIGDSVAFPLTVPAGAPGQPSGYVVQWRRFRITGLDQVSRLLGARTDIYLGNRTGRVWTDFTRLVEPPAADDSALGGLMAYTRSRIGAVLAIATPVATTPWRVLVETSHDAVMAPARSFLLRLSVLGVIILALGLSATVWLSRRLTRPLARLADAAKQVADGDYSQHIGLAPRDDELGRLAESFDSMVSRVQAAFGAQRSAEEYYRRLFEAVPLPLWVVDRDSARFLAVNDVALAHYGYSREEFLAMTIADLRAPDSRPPVRDANREHDVDVLAGGAWRHVTQDGTVIDVETRARAIVFGGQHAAITVVNDVTERNRAAEAMRRSEAKYQALIREAPTGITLSTLGGNLLAANPAFLAMMGFTSESEALAVDTRQLYEAPGTRAELLDALEHGNHIDRKEIALRRTDGSLITARCTIRLVTDPSTGEQHIEAISEDVTEQRKIERQFQQAQKMEAVGQLAGGIAHDFNNMLTVIISYSDLLLAGLGADDARREEVLAIRAAGKSAATLTRQLLIFSRQQVVQPRVMHLNDLVVDTGAMLNRLIGESIVLQTVLDPDAGAVKVDQGQMEQVIVNLAVNARDAMPDGGRLLIESKNVTFDAAYAVRNRLYPAGRYVSLIVSDNGLGMDEEMQARIFEPFFTTKEPGKGTGLGLATVYGIVKQSGGYISVYSEPGNGTSFKIYFPRIDESDAPVERVSASVPAVGGTETLLVVEDDETVRKMVRLILERDGYIVLAVPNGEEALALATAHGGPIDLLVTDVVMPGISGRVLADRFAALRPESRLLFVSGYTDDALVYHGVLEAGMHYLEKPFTPDSLSRMVRRVLDSALT